MNASNSVPEALSSTSTDSTDRPLPATARVRGEVPMIGVREVLEQGAPVIDLRSPSEYALDHLPGALSVPLFGDVERAIIGTLYKQTSPQAAFDEARGLARARIQSLVTEISNACGWHHPDSQLEERLLQMTEGGVERLEGELTGRTVERLDPGSVVLHCWRGGLRSRSVVSFLNAIGAGRAVLLEGGYKSYRREVVRQLAAASFPPAFVLRGLTGVGKTLVLRELERLRPGWTIDLEQLAGHRSSILGMVGLEPRSQKSFESLLAAQLRGGLSDCIVFEGESRKVGDVIVPASVWSALDSGTNIKLTAPVAYRVQVLIDDYLQTPESRDQLREQLPFIEDRLGSTKWRGELVQRLDDGRERELVEILLERYYDPLYSHSEKQRSFALSLDSSDPRRAAQEVLQFALTEEVPMINSASS